MKKIFPVIAVAIVFAACSSKKDLETSKDLIPFDTTASHYNTYSSDTAVTQVYVKPKTVTKTTKVTTTSATTKPAASTTTTTTTTQKKGWSSAAKGAVIGGASGAILGAVVSKNKVKGAVIGGVAGAGVGYVIGRGKDKKTGRAK